MKRRTRIIAWIFLIFTVYACWSGVVMLLGMSHGYSKLPWYLTAQILMGGLQWPFWIFLLKKRVWAWYILTAVYLINIAQWLYTVGGHLMYGAAGQGIQRPLISNVIISAYALIITIVPLLALLTDRPDGWNPDSDESSLTDDEV